MNTHSSNSFFNRIYRRVSKSLNILLYGNQYSIYANKIYAHHEISFSQEGEDLVLKRMFESKEKGFYVDVGAHHPQRFSNTYVFYLRGWRGINIDAIAVLNQNSIHGTIVFNN